MDSIRFVISGDRQAGLRFEEFPDDLRDELRQEIDGLRSELFDRIEAAIPSRTGDLRSKLDTKLFNDKESIKGSVYISGKGTGSSSDYAKAGALEYGSTGKPFEVSAHFRSLDHVFGRKLAQPMVVLVDAFDRIGNIGAHSFMRWPLNQMRSEIETRLNAVVEKSVAKANA